MAPSKGDRILLMASRKNSKLTNWVFFLTQKQVEELHAGEVGYLAAAIKAVADARVGDTD